MLARTASALALASLLFACSPGGGPTGTTGPTGPTGPTAACGACPAGQTCGGGGVPSRCGTLVPVCSDGWCWSTPLPQGNDLRAVFARSTTDVFAVGEQGTILHWTGDRLEAMPSPTRRTLNGVWGTATGTDVWAVGEDSVILRYDGTSWKVEQDAVIEVTGTDLLAVFGTGAGDVWAVGESGRVLHRGAAGTWTVQRPGGADTTLLAVWTSGPGDVWIVAGSIAPPTLLHWDGSTWSSRALPDDGYAVWGTGRNDVWVVGPDGIWGGLAYHYDGTTWTTKGASGVGRSLSGTGPTDIWAVDGSRFLRHWDGTQWTEVKLPVDAQGVGAVAAAARDAVWAVGLNGGIWYYDGAAWAPVSSSQRGTTESFSAISGAGGEVWAVGASLVARYNGVRWSLDRTARARDVWAVAANDVWLAAAGTPSRLLRWSGTSIETALDAAAQPALNIGELKVVWAGADGEVWAFAESGKALHRTASGWGVVDVPAQVPALWSVADLTGSSGDLYLAGNVTLHWDGVSWAELPGDPGNSYGAFRGADLWVTAYSGVHQVSGATWTQRLPDEAAWPGAIAGIAPSDVYVSATRGWTDVPGGNGWLLGADVLRWDGAAFQHTHPPVAAVSALWAHPAGNGFDAVRAWALASTQLHAGGVLVRAP
ncbi:WD40/YVTN/BNR-like repeat-containing protein [Anaeromyxobacter oryzae]|uniref:Glucosyltransferase-I n=1 Tax=Anaeromyxobacter oryzae TaxID=2918170 RepID=A0ABM7WVB7_9BACT|nr:hypothetical protein [Anaeromyxobacter oryzae]BDG03397.1 hypothetical protein AMOR_23930 [Anaeromyxobacter oryzae]